MFRAFLTGGLLRNLAFWKKAFGNRQGSLVKRLQESVDPSGLARASQSPDEVY